jgi:hypothetical protein
MQLNRIISLSLVIIFILSPFANAQVTVNGSIRGRITDATGGAIPGASVTLTNALTNVSIQSSSNEEGLYTFPRVVPGRYSLEVQKEGFQRALREGLIVEVNESAAADIQLEIGSMSSVVAVEASLPVVQSQSVEISGVVTERKVKELPLNGRNFQALVLLAPGVGGSSGSTPNNPAISGARPAHNNYVVDGVSSNDERLAVGCVGLSNGSGTDPGFNIPT